MPRLTPLALSTLALLAERPMHPYEMYQLMLQRREDRVVKVSAGSLYRAVERLAADGYIAETGVEREGNRPERTVYTITAEGRDAVRSTLEQMLPEFVNEFPEFPMAIGEAHNLPSERVAELLDERVARIREFADLIDRGLEHIAEKGVARHFVLNVHYTRAMLTAELDWAAPTDRHTRAD